MEEELSDGGCRVVHSSIGRLAGGGTAGGDVGSVSGGVIGVAGDCLRCSLVGIKISGVGWVERKWTALLYGEGERVIGSDDEVSKCLSCEWRVGRGQALRRTVGCDDVEEGGSCTDG